MIILQYHNEPFRKIASERVGQYAKDHYYLVVEESRIKAVQLDKIEMQDQGLKDLDFEFILGAVLSGSWTRVTESNPWVENHA